MKKFFFTLAVVAALFTASCQKEEKAADNWRNTISYWANGKDTLWLSPKTGSASFSKDNKYTPESGSGKFTWTDDTHIKFTDFIITGPWGFVVMKMEDGTLNDEGYMQRLLVTYRENTADKLNGKEPVWSDELKTERFQRFDKK